MKVVVVLPTYNEKENIAILIPKIVKISRSRSLNLQILVVEDNSPDGTSKVVKNLQKKYKNIHMITGKKKGLGIAYMRGFAYAMDEMGADAIVMMDSDLSHPVNMLPQLIKGLENNDVVIGSRYVKGGGTPDWNLSRKIISSGGNFFARIVAGIYKIHDCTSGFRAIKASTLKKINTKNLYTRGYAFLSTLLYELINVGAKFKEVPLVFYDRKYGKTKLNYKDMIEFFLNAFRLRFRSTTRMIKFATVGASGIIVNLGIFTLTKSFLFRSYGESNSLLLTSSLIGDELSIIYNFMINNVWTFKHSKNKDHIFSKFIKFNFIAIASVIINNLVLFLLHLFLGVNAIIAKFIGILVAFFWNYLANSKWTWRE